MEINDYVQQTISTIKGYAYGNRITREDLMAVLYLSKNIRARDMFKLIVEQELIELIKGEPRFPDKEDEFKITDKGFDLIGEQK
jgi:hypothetical protein